MAQAIANTTMRDQEYRATQVPRGVPTARSGPPKPGTVKTQIGIMPANSSPQKLDPAAPLYTLRRSLVVSAGAAPRCFSTSKKASS